MRARRLYALIVKEIIELSRDSVLVIFLIYAFTGDILVAAKGVRLDLRNAGISALNQDHGPIGRELIAEFAPPYFRIHSETSEDAIMRRLDAGQDVAAIVIPPKFDARIARDDAPSVQLLLDGSSATQASLAEGYAREIGVRVAEKTAIERLRMPPGAGKTLPIVGSELRVDFNPNRNEEWFQGLQEMLMMISLLAIALPAAALIREREHGTIELLADLAGRTLGDPACQDAREFADIGGLHCGGGLRPRHPAVARAGPRQPCAVLREYGVVRLHDVRPRAAGRLAMPHDAAGCDDLNSAGRPYPLPFRRMDTA